MDALEGITVLDLTSHIAGPYATKLLADLGARVIKVERPGGDPSRALGPFLGDQPGPERSATFQYLNTNKESVVLDLRQPEGRQAVYDLLPSADLVVTSFPPRVAARLGMEPETLRGHADVPVLAITNFGRSGPYRDYALSDTVLYAMGGEMFSHGIAGREPLKLGGTAALLQCGAMGAIAALGALHAWEAHGVGQVIDLALLDVQINSVDRRSSAILGYRWSGRINSRPPGAGAGIAGGIYPVADGYVEATAGAGTYWQRLVAMIGDDALRDPKWLNPAIALDPAAKEEADGIIYPWMLSRTRQEVWAAAREAHAMVAPLFTATDIWEDAVLRERGLWTEIDHPVLGRLPMLGRPYRLDRTPWRLRRAAPVLGAEEGPHPRPLSRRSGRGEPESGGAAEGWTPPLPLRRERGPGGEGRSALPLAGVRICDFSAVWAGQSATMYLADLGAECIKVENPFVWNPMTRASSPRVDRVLAGMIPPWMGGHPGGDPGARPWNNCPAFIHVLRNKQSFTVDSRRPEGLALVQALVRTSDVIAENLAIGTLEKLGLDDAAVRALRPDLVILHMPAFGRSGAYVQGRGYGSHIDGVAGSTVLRGYRDSAPASNVSIFAGDFFAGMHGAVAVLAALRHRRRTGEGQTIELSQLECSAQMFPQAALDAAWNGRAAGSIGNRSIEGFVPNGVFPVRGEDPGAPGQGRWIAISCRSDGEWAALVRFMGSPAWAGDDALATAAGRAAVEDEIEARLAEWTAGQDQVELFHALQSAGVTAGPVLNARDAADDPHLAATGAWQTLPATADYPETPFHRPAYRFSDADTGIRTPPALFGQHNEYVYRELLGLDDEECARLRAEGHMADAFDSDLVARGG